MKYGITAGLPDLPAGLPDKEFNALAPVYRAIHTVAQQTARQANVVQYDPGELAKIDPLVGVKTDRNNRIVIKAGEALNYGHLVYLTAVGGTLVAYKADYDASTGHRAVACVASPSGLALNAFGEAVFMSGLCAGISGTVLGTQYYLGAAGVATAGVTSGKKQQAVGIGLGTAGLFLTITADIVAVVSVTTTAPNTHEVVYSDGTVVTI